MLHLYVLRCCLLCVLSLVCGVVLVVRCALCGCCYVLCVGSFFLVLRSAFVVWCVFIGARCLVCVVCCLLWSSRCVLFVVG